MHACRYGQTNCFILPEGEYGAYQWGKDPEGNEIGILIMSARSARNMAYQTGACDGTVNCLLTMKGSDLMGLPVKAPRAVYERVYVLPLPTISMGKGTGVVTSVPSDAPDDYAALAELKKKKEWRESFGLTDEMVLPFEVVPIIEIPGYGDKSAEFMVNKLKIQSCKDVDKLKQAKEETYLKGFTDGIMLVGEYKGQKVQDAKPIIKKDMIKAGEAIAYSEPEGLVMSRTNDECVVAMTDQWYLVYGQENWKDPVVAHVKSDQFETYTHACQDQFNMKLDWLKEWACSIRLGIFSMSRRTMRWSFPSSLTSMNRMGCMQVRLLPVT